MHDTAAWTQKKHGEGTDCVSGWYRNRESDPESSFGKTPLILNSQHNRVNYVQWLPTSETTLVVGEVEYFSTVKGG